MCAVDYRLAIKKKKKKTQKCKKFKLRLYVDS